MVVVPIDNAVTNPDEDIVATDAFEDIHGFVNAGVAEPKS